MKLRSLILFLVVPIALRGQAPIRGQTVAMDLVTPDATVAPTLAIGTGTNPDPNSYSIVSIGTIPFSVSSLANTAAWYSLAGSASDSTYLLSSGNVQLVADRSGNSSVNCLVNSGGSSNYASLTLGAALGSGSFTITGKATMTADANRYLTGAPGNNGCAVGRESGGWKITQSGIAVIASFAGAAPVGDFTFAYVRNTASVGSEGQLYINGVSLGSSADTTNYSATAVLLGSYNAASFNWNGTIQFERFYNVALSSAQIALDAAGTVQTGCVMNANFAALAKLTTSFTEFSSNAKTVTITTSGDLGARISGARDLIQMTAANRPAFSVIGGYNTATFDGTNDYLSAQSWSMVQPETVYGVISQVTWTNADQIWAGTAATSMGLLQSGLTPALVINAGSSVASNTGLVLATKAVAAAVYSGASSSLTINLGTATTGSAGVTAGGGFTIGATSAGVNAANITFNEAIVRSVADSSDLQRQIAVFEINHWGVVR